MHERRACKACIHTVAGCPHALFSWIASLLGPHSDQRSSSERCAVGAAQMVEYWTYALFFCVAELWGPIVISVLFWTLANEVCTVQDARTIYPLMGIAANIALVVAGVFIKHVTAAVPQARVTSLALIIICVMYTEQQGLGCHALSRHVLQVP